MTTRKILSWGVAQGAALVLGIAASGAALAAPANTTVTFVPSASTPPLTTPTIGGNSTDFTTGNFQVADYAVATINDGTGSFTENGYLKFVAVAGGVNPPGFNGPTGGTSYSLYINFSASGHRVTNLGGGDGIFKIDAITYNLVGDPGNDNVYSAVGGVLSPPSPLPGVLGGDVLLGSGGLLDNTANAAIIAGRPSASANLTFTPAAGQQPFFDGFDFGTMTLDLLSSFTNPDGTFTVVDDGTNTTVTINQGGGAIQLAASPVPEPAALALLGGGLLGLGLIRRRKA